MQIRDISRDRASSENGWTDFLKTLHEIFIRLKIFLCISDSSFFLECLHTRVYDYCVRFLRARRYFCAKQYFGFYKASQMT